MKLPRLGPRGEGWVAIQLVLGGLVAAAQMIGPHGPALWALAFVAVGCALLGWAAWALGRALSPFPRPRPGVRRITRGPYGFMGHPMYVAVVLICVGASIRAPLAAIPGALLAVVLTLKARIERDWLDEVTREGEVDARQGRRETTA